jgi:hypothetical protein
METLKQILRNEITKETLCQFAEQGKVRHLELCVANGYLLPICFKTSYKLMQKPVLEYFERRIHAHRKMTRIIGALLKRKRVQNSLLIVVVWAERYII